MSNDASQAFRSSLKTQEPGGFLDGSARSHLFQPFAFLNLFKIFSLFCKIRLSTSLWCSTLDQRSAPAPAVQNPENVVSVQIFRIFAFQTVDCMNMLRSRRAVDDPLYYLDANSAAPRVFCSPTSHLQLLATEKMFRLKILRQGNM